MSDSPTRRIQIGDEEYKVTRFKGLKATLAGALLSRISTEVPQLQDEVAKYRKEFRTKNTVTVTPAMAKTPRFSELGLTPADFEASGGVVELPEEPVAQAVLIHIFPRLFSLCRKELQRFLALLVISNAELAAADDADDVEGALDRVGKQLIRGGDIDELLELLVVGAEVFKEQMAAKRDRLGKLPIPLLRWVLDLTAEEPKENDGPGENTQIPIAESPSPQPNSPASSSDDSPENTAGLDETSSMASLG